MNEILTDSVFVYVGKTNYTYIYCQIHRISTSSG